MISDSGMDPVWLNDSKRILYTEKGRFYIMDTRSGKSKFIYNINQLFTPTANMYTMSPDNKTIYYIKEEKNPISGKVTWGRIIIKKKIY